MNLAQNVNHNAGTYRNSRLWKFVKISLGITLIPLSAKDLRIEKLLLYQTNLTFELMTVSLRTPFINDLKKANLINNGT